MHGCEHTDDHEDRWCYVRDAEGECEGSVKTSKEGQYWDTCGATTTTTTISPKACTAPECATENGCWCLKTWQFDGKTVSGCKADAANPFDSWCYVADPQCAGAMTDAASPSMKRDKCGNPGACTSSSCQTMLGCHCLKSWTYAGNSYGGCTYTPDSQKPWCFVADSERCSSLGAGTSELGTGGVWDVCPMGEITDHKCHCEIDWSYGGEDFNGCAATADNPESWCYVRDGGSCDGSIKTNKEGLYWDTCQQKQQ